jgi:hypothetical protein
MTPTDRPSTSNLRLGVAAVLAGLILQFPWAGGVTSDPPTCFGMFGLWTVPCGGWPTVAGGVLTALLVWLVLVVRENPKLT